MVRSSQDDEVIETVKTSIETVKNSLLYIEFNVSHFSLNRVKKIDL